jgi:hypothetical protein
MGNLLAISNWDEGWAKNYYTKNLKNPKLNNIPIYSPKTKGGSKKTLKTRANRNKKTMTNRTTNTKIK